MEFKEIYYLGLTGLIPFYIYFSYYSFQKSGKILHWFSGEKRSLKRFFFSTLSMSLAIAFMSISLARPGIKYEKIEFSRSKIEILLGIDVSKSMLAEDVVFPGKIKKPSTVLNRLNKARSFALNFISFLDGEQIGLYIFAEKSTEIIPMTNDYAYVRYILTHVNESSMTVPGSNMSRAVKIGTGILKQSKRKGAKILILISDGEDTGSEESLDNACKKSAKNGVIIYTAGIGGDNNVMIPVRTSDGSLVTGYLKDEKGTFFKTRLEEKTLKKIAGMTGGQYFQPDKGFPAKELIKNIGEKAGNIEQAKQVVISRFSLSPVFLLAGLIFFILGFVF